MAGSLDATAPSESMQAAAVFGRMGRGRYAGFVVTMFATSYVVFSAFIAIPVISNFYVLFADRLSMVNYIVSGGLLVAILANLVGARLMRRLRKRTLLVVGLVLFTVAGTLQVAVLDVWYIAVMGTLTGVACGLVVIAAPALLAEANPDEKRRGNILGWYNAVGSVTGALLSLLGGAVAARTSSWTSVYWLYLGGLVVLALVLVFVPPTPTDAEKEEESATLGPERLPRRAMAALSVAGFSLSLVYMVPVYLISLLVLQRHLGDESTSGMLSSVTTVGSAVGCAVFGVLYRTIGRLVATCAFAVMAVAVLLLLTTGLGTVVVGCLLLGLSYGAGFVYYTVHATSIAPASKVSLALAVSWAMINLGGFASTYAVTALQHLLGIPDVAGVLPYLVGLMVLATVLSLGLAVAGRRRRAGVSPADLTEVRPPSEVV